MTLFCIIVLIVGLFLWFKVAKQYEMPINHVNIFSVVWLTILCGSMLFPLDFKIELRTYLVLLISWLFYLFGSFSLKNKSFDEPSVAEYDLKRMKIVLYALLVLSMLAYLLSLKDVLYFFTSLESWATLRGDSLFLEATSENIFYTIFARNYSIYLPLAIYLFSKGNLKKKYLILIFLYGLFTSILSFSRAPLLELIVVSAVSYMYVYKVYRIPVVKIVLFVLFFVTIFIFSQSVLFSLNEYSSFDAEYQVKMYLFGSVSNYQLILDGLYPDRTVYDSVFYSFDFINYILQRFGAITNFPSQVREFNNYIDGSNVYTYIDAFTLDFGIWGAFIGSFLIAVFNKYIYILYSKKSSLFSLIIYSLICYFSIMMFVNNEYIRFAFLLFIVKVKFIDIICVKYSHSINSPK